MATEAKGNSRSAAGAGSELASWDRYWRGTHENAALQESGAQDSALAEFWLAFFQQHLDSEDSPRVLDLACGNGAVTGFARAACPGASLFAVDGSASALQALQQRYPESHCVVADAAALPFPPQSFTVVASQFGVEYAGLAALENAAELVEPDGYMVALLHLQDGVIHRECAANLDAILALQQIELLPLARSAFAAGFALNAGTGSVAAFKEAEQRFTPAVRALEKLLRDRGDGMAGGLARQLYRDIAQMYPRMSAYEPAELLSWVDGMVVELEAYRLRMAAMVEVAQDRQAVEKVVKALQADGLELQRFDQLGLAASAREAGAWQVVLKRA